MLGITPTHSETLFHLCFPAVRRPGKGKENDLLAGFRADVMVHGHDCDASDILDHRFEDRTGRFNQMCPYLLQQVPAFSGAKAT